MHSVCCRKHRRLKDSHSSWFINEFCIDALDHNDDDDDDDDGNGDDYKAGDDYEDNDGDDNKDCKLAKKKEVIHTQVASLMNSASILLIITLMMMMMLMATVMIMRTMTAMIIWTANIKYEGMYTVHCTVYNLVGFKKIFVSLKPDPRGTNENVAKIDAPTVSKSFQSETFQWGHSCCTTAPANSKH